MPFQTKVVDWVSAEIGKNTNRYITKILPLTKEVAMEYGVPEWAMRKGIALRTDAMLFATENLRLKKTANKTWASQDDFPFRVHFCYKDE
jgi:hypothetical protein